MIRLPALDHNGTVRCPDCHGRGNRCGMCGDTGRRRAVYVLDPETAYATEQRVEKLARRAAKLGLDAPSIEDCGTVTRRDEPDADGYESRRTFKIVRLHGAVPRYDGWTALARIDLDPDQPDAPNVLAAFPGETADPAWRDAGDDCDHCHRPNTGRKALYALAHQDGRKVIVGSTCLDSYVGAKGLLAYAKALAALDEDMEEGNGAGGTLAYSPAEILTYAAASIRTSGWVAKGTAYERGGESTAERVEAGLRSSGPRDLGYIETTSADQATAQAALAWARSLATSDDNDYLANLAALARHDHWTAKQFGLGVSMVGSHQRHLDRQVREQAKAERPSAPCPTGRTVVEGTVIKVTWQDNDFGGRLVWTVADDAGYLVWGSVPSALNVTTATGDEAPDGYHGVGARVRFTATLTRSDRDETFGFAKRPAKAEILAEAS